ncbi:unnamed protein product [Darwinula stevensoni]|uniref:ornithine decarboxylase n=1 Tax=Darwinula stevensoni TaxID=69355 RepID=A0A7R9A3P1_9CRUS|nr:unnamed protein product [Darwinula stevensoni]CAG0882533.1 unnamed protein product [Darwinula stevensoni]
MLLRDFKIQLFNEDFNIKKILEEIIHIQGQEDAFYVVDIDDLVKKHKNWCDKLPRVQPFYAVKCNDTQAMLEILAALGVGFDCASKAEIQKVKSLGVSSDRIIYANPCKTNSYIRYAASQGVTCMTFDNATELYKIKQNFPSAELVLRIRCDAKEAQCPLGSKFGAIPSAVPELLTVARELGLNLIGVSFHVGSGCADVTAYSNAISSAKEVFTMAAHMGFQFRLLDLGGGYPGHHNHGFPTFDQLADSINDALDEHFPRGCGVRIIAEPGRYYVSSAFTLATCVIAKREVLNDTSQGTMYYTNDGVYGSFNCLLYDHAAVQMKSLKEYQEKDWCMPSSIWGPTCDSLDCILKRVLMPSMDVGDWLYWPNMGAYTCSAASTFNGFPRPEFHYVASEFTWSYLADLLAVCFHEDVEASSVDEDLAACLKLPSPSATLRILSIETTTTPSENDIETETLLPIELLTIAS